VIVFAASRPHRDLLADRSVGRRRVRATDRHAVVLLGGGNNTFFFNVASLNY
jgi:hypothetical protein